MRASKQICRSKPNLEQRCHELDLHELDLQTTLLGRVQLETEMPT